MDILDLVGKYGENSKIMVYIIKKNRPKFKFKLSNWEKIPLIWLYRKFEAEQVLTNQPQFNKEEAKQKLKNIKIPKELNEDLEFAKLWYDEEIKTELLEKYYKDLREYYKNQLQKLKNEFNKNKANFKITEIYIYF